MQTTVDIERKASAHWEGEVQKGNGRVKTESGALDQPYSFGRRFGNDAGTNPEELIAAAHAACFTMALSATLTRAGHPPTSLDTNAVVHLRRVESAFSITTIELTVEGVVPGIDAETFAQTAYEAERNCPVSKALAGAEIVLEASLKS